MQDETQFSLMEKKNASKIRGLSWPFFQIQLTRLLSYFLGLWVRKVVLAENKYLNRSMKISTFSKCRFCSNDVIVWNLNIHYDPKISQCKSKFILASIARSKVTGTEKKHVSYKKLILKVKFKNSELHHSFYLRTI